MSNKLFRYSGNKTRLSPKYLSPTRPYTTIYEPYAGSMSYSLSKLTTGITVRGVEKDPRLSNLYTWLLSPSIEVDLVKVLSKFNEKSDNFHIDTFDGTEPEKSYVRLNSGSMMTGHIDKNIIYRYAKPLDSVVDQTLVTLSRISSLNVDFRVDVGDCLLYDDSFVGNDTLIFVDPPYLGSGNLYGKFTLDDSRRLADKIAYWKSKGSQIIFTHGDNAELYYPEFTWTEVTTVVNSKSRLNSSKRSRVEYVSYINF